MHLSLAYFSARIPINNSSIIREQKHIFAYEKIFMRVKG